MTLLILRNKRSHLALVCIGLVSVATIAIWFAMWQRRSDWVKLFDETPRFDPEVLRQAGGGAFELDHRIQEIVRRPMWDVSDINEMWEIYGRYNRDLSTYPKDAPRSDWIPILVAMSAHDYIGFRFAYGAPVTPSARERYLSLLVEDMFSSIAGRRSSAALALILGTGTLEEPGVRAQVERLLDDPDEEVRKVVALQLGYHDEAKRRQGLLDERKKTIGKP